MEMKTRCQAFQVAVLLTLAVCVGTTWAADVKEASSLYRKAERSFFSGKAEEANATLKQVEAIIEEAKNEDASSVKTIEGKTTRLRKRINDKLGIGSEEAPKAPSTESQAVTSKAAEELPSGVTSRIRMANQYLDNGLPSLEEAREAVTKFDEDGKSDYKYAIRNAERSLSNAKSKLEEMKDRYGDKYSPDHPDVVAVHEKMAKLDTGVDEVTALREKGEATLASQAALGQEASAEWITRLEPYVTSQTSPGYDKEKYFIGSYTEEKEELVNRQNIALMVRKELEAYRKSGVAEKATDDLQEIVKELEDELKGFDENCTGMANFRLDEAEKQIDYLINWTQEQAKKIGTDELPLSVNKFALENARRPLDLGKRILPEDNQRVIAIENKYAKILEENKKLVKARISETRMIADKFSGKDAEQLKAKAKEILKAKYSDVKPLRTTVISDDWKEESVVEWTDTTRSAWRHRVTHYVTAQVGGTKGKEAKIYTIHIGKDRRSDGSWGALYGHIMFEDPILEENIEK